MRAALTTNDAGTLVLSVAAPAEAPAGHHAWVVNLMPDGGGARALTLGVSRDYGTEWTAAPRMIRMPPKADEAFAAMFVLKPAGFDSSALKDIDLSAIEITPGWDGVVFEPIGKSLRAGVSCKLTIPPEMINSWERPKTFNITIPGSGSASLYLTR